MALYDGKLLDFIIQGINISHYGEARCVRSYGGDFVDPQSGANGDKVTYALYNQMNTFQISQLFNSPIWTQVESWAKNHTKLTIQFTDGNTGEKKTSTTAYIQSLGDITDGQERTFTVYCEEVV